MYKIISWSEKIVKNDFCYRDFILSNYIRTKYLYDSVVEGGHIAGGRGGGGGQHRPYSGYNITGMRGFICGPKWGPKLQRDLVPSDESMRNDILLVLVMIPTRSVVYLETHDVYIQNNRTYIN